MITIPNTVTRIEVDAFFKKCSSLRRFQLPLNLHYIGRYAFANCSSLLEVICIPSTVTWIDDDAFKNCKSLRIINIPYHSIQQIGYDVLRKCDDLITDEAKGFTTHQEFDQWLRNCHNPLHNVCWDPSITANNVQQYIQTHHNDEERATTKE